MKRRLLFRAIVLAALLAAGSAVQRPAASAAAAEEPRVSLSGVLDLPAGELQSLAVKDPFRSPIVPRAAGAQEDGKAPELPPLRLTAVLQGSGSTAAVVNGVILRPGDSFLGMRVLEINKTRVLFQQGERKVTLLMQERLYNPLSPGGK